MKTLDELKAERESLIEVITTGPSVNKDAVIDAMVDHLYRAAAVDDLGVSKIEFMEAHGFLRNDIIKKYVASLDLIESQIAAIVLSTPKDK